MTSGVTIVMLKLRNATLGVGADVSVSETEKLKRPEAVGVPEIIPVRAIKRESRRQAARLSRPRSEARFRQKNSEMWCKSRRKFPKAADHW